MSDQAPSLKHILFPEGEGPSRDFSSRLQKTEAMEGLRDRVLQKLPDLDWGSRSHGIAAKVVSLLEVDLLGDVLIKVWNEGKLFRKYLDRETYRPQDIVEVALVDHTITSTHEPHLKMYLNGTPIRDIAFDVTVTIKVEGIILDIQDGMIVRIRTGKAKGKGTLKWHEVTLASQDFKPISFPGDHTFKEAIPILP